MKFKAQILDVFKNKITPAKISINNGKFTKIQTLDQKTKHHFQGIILPGFIDSHIHIESSMLTPSQFAKIAVKHGTTSAICDPHEIANVSGEDGINFMIQNAKSTPFDFYFTAPSCVPATKFETSGSTIDTHHIKKLLQNDNFVALGEMMNFPGVINKDKKVIDKIKIAHNLNKPIDGHCPLLSGKSLDKYIHQQILTDHESSTFQEAIEKKEKGMKIMVRDGSSAKNLESLLDYSKRTNYLKNKSDNISSPIFDFIVSDDKHVGDLIEGHLNKSIKKAKKLKIDIIEAIKMITINPANFYNINSGAIAEGRLANFIIVDNLTDLNIKKTYIHGKLVFDGLKTLFNVNKTNFKNTFNVCKIQESDFNINYNEKNEAIVNVIECYNGELLTSKLESTVKTENNVLQPNLDEDILKIAVVERYGGNTIANAFIKGFCLKKGALASSVSHDSHNIVVVGTNPQDMANAVNLIVKNQGGIAIAYKNFTNILKLPIAGLMSNEKGEIVAHKINQLLQKLKEWGCKLKSPFTTLSFMALLVIPEIKISNKGLFDCNEFKFIDVIKS